MLDRCWWSFFWYIIYFTVTFAFYSSFSSHKIIKPNKLVSVLFLKQNLQVVLKFLADNIDFCATFVAYGFPTCIILVFIYAVYNTHWPKYIQMQSQWKYRSIFKQTTLCDIIGISARLRVKVYTELITWSQYDILIAMNIIFIFASIMWWIRLSTTLRLSYLYNCLYLQTNIECSNAF